MSYTKIFLNQQSAKIPSIFFLIAVSFISFFLIRLLSNKPLVSRAAKSSFRQLLIVNPSYNQFGVFWQTEEKEMGWLIYGEKENKLDKIVFDERDTSDRKNPYRNHYVLVKNLEQNKTYFFKIVSNKQLISDLNNQPFSFTTPGNISALSNIRPAYGRVVDVNGLPLSSGMVILSFDNSYPLLATLKLSGEWLIPLNNILNKTTGRIKNLAGAEIGLVEIYSEEGVKSSIKIIPANLSPLPQTVVIGTDYSFVNQENVLAATDTKKDKKEIISIIYPKEEGIIPGEDPLIKGTAIPNREVMVIIESKESFSTRVITDQDGIWIVKLKEKLSPGEHRLTIITRDQKGKEVKLSRRFTIAKSGEQVLGEATPEPTLTKQPTPTSTPRPTDYPPTSTPVPTLAKSGFSPLPLTLISGSLIITGLAIILAF